MIELISQWTWNKCITCSSQKFWAQRFSQWYHPSGISEEGREKPHSVNLLLSLLNLPKVHPATYSCESPFGSWLTSLILPQPLIVELWGCPVPFMFQRLFWGKENWETCNKCTGPVCPSELEKNFICCHVKIFCGILYDALVFEPLL